MSFHVSAVVNGVNGRLRYRHRKSRMPHVVTIMDEQDTSVATSHIHTSAMIAVQLASKRGIAKTRCWSPLSLPPPQIQNAACRHNRRRANSFARSQVRQRRHDRRSARIEMQHRQSATVATSRIRRHETASFEYPSIRFRRSSRYQVTPHRMSCPCLVSFSVGHYDVLVSTPDSMFSVV